MFNLMYKKLSLLLLLFACSLAWTQAQTYSVTLQGTLLETGTGNPIANHDVYINYDSSAGFFYFNIVQTDAAGAWSDVATGVNVPGGDVLAYTFDCNGNYVQLGNFAYTANNNNFTSTYMMCAPSTANCAASFGAFPVQGTTIYNFYDFSTAGSPAASVNSWSWDFGDGNTSTQQNPTHTYNAVGPYRVCLTIGTTAGCTATYCDSTVFGGGPGSCSAFMNYSQVGCSFTFYDSSYAAAGVAQTVWDFGDGNTATGSMPTHTYAANGTYTVCLTVIANDSCIDTYCVTVSCGVPACQASYYWFPDTTGQYSIILVNNSTGNGLSYYWDFGDGDSSSLQYPSHVYAGPGSYIVCLTVYNAFLGCSSTYCDSLLVLNKMSSSVPFSINVVSPLTAVTPPAVGPAMQLSPNPANSEVRLAINLENQGQGAVRLLDVQGRVVKAIDLGYLAAGLHQQTLDLTTLPDGIYLVELMVGGQRTVQKLVVTE
jgi:PKD repeat protein